MAIRENLDRRPWTPDDDMALKRLWVTERLHPVEIGARLERSDKAVICRVYRKGWISPRGHRDHWSAEEVAQLERLWKHEGLTYNEIGEAMGRSRNSIIGRVGRQGWAAQGAAPASRPKPERAPRAAPPSLPSRPRPPPPGPGPILSPAAKPWLERERGECAFPLTPPGAGADTVSCCNPTYGFTYCPGHAAVMHPKPSG